MDVIIPLLAVLGGLIIGAGAGYYGQKAINRKRIGEANAESIHIVDAASEQSRAILVEANEQSRAILVEAKENALKQRSEDETEIRAQRAELNRSDRRLASREENLDHRANNMEKRERGLTEKEVRSEELRSEIEQLRDQALVKIEEVAGLTSGEAKDLVMRKAEDEIQHEIALRYRDLEEEAEARAHETSSRILATSIQRMAGEFVSEFTTATVPLPSDDMKGRLIGREGRNIRAIEKTTGVDLLIDDTPESVTISCFDPIRREVARVAVTKLVADGRIHPARVEEMVERATTEVEASIWKHGQDAVFDAGLRGFNPEIVKLIGRLKYRYSYGENVLQHSLEVAHLSGMIAAELGADINLAKTGGLLHDIGKALTHEVEGPHAEIGAEIAAKYNVPSNVCACIAEHHDDVMSSTEAFIVAAADAISAARPGARSDTVENYVKRLEALEEVARGFDGVEKCFALQAGREVRVMVKPEAVDDVTASQMARDIVKQIEKSLVYPGQIKVMVIRESRAIEFAR